jgi:Sap-like sulfolipid-1-addressing protein
MSSRPGDEEAVAVSWVQILPLAFVMIAGPQIISSFFLATSEGWARNSLAYIAGAGLSITTMVSIAYFVGRGSKSAAGSHSGTADSVIDWVVLALLLFLIVHVYLTRHTSEPPKWMSKLQLATPRFSFLLGLVLLGVFPTDIASSFAAGLHVARNGDPWWQCLPFVGLTLLLLAFPSLTVVVLGKRASSVLPKVRDWMNANAWVINEIVLVFFAALTINSLAG